MVDDKHKGPPREGEDESPDLDRSGRADMGSAEGGAHNNADNLSAQGVINESIDNSLKAVVMGEVMQEWPKDLFIPPDALEVVLESFEGPLDLLLYLIRKQNIDILNIPVADITRQYMTYVELMRAANLDLAAEYLVMAALLGEIKSRMLLPKPKSDDDDDEDPRAALVRRLQEYERFSKAANLLDDRPRLDRDVFKSQAVFDDPFPPKVEAQVTLRQLAAAYQGAIDRVAANTHMLVSRDMLSMRERMTQILQRLRSEEFVRFEDLFVQSEGRLGVVVTFIALLELFRDDMLVVVQAEPFAAIHVKRAA